MITPNTVLSKPYPKTTSSSATGVYCFGETCFNPFQKKVLIYNNVKPSIFYLILIFSPNPSLEDPSLFDAVLEVSQFVFPAILMCTKDSSDAPFLIGEEQTVNRHEQQSNGFVSGIT